MSEMKTRYAEKGRSLFFLLIGLSLYWFVNATIWIPWVYISKTAGIVMMVILVPILWGYGAYFCFQHTPEEQWKRQRWSISLLFFLSSAVSDFFFFLIWRRLSVEELYHVSTIASYALIIVLPFIVEKIAKHMYKKGRFKAIVRYRWTWIIVFTAVCAIATLYCVRFW